VVVNTQEVEEVKEVKEVEEEKSIEKKQEGFANIESNRSILTRRNAPNGIYKFKKVSL
jgi:hypothetical protein